MRVILQSPTSSAKNVIKLSSSLVKKCILSILIACLVEGYSTKGRGFGTSVFNMLGRLLGANTSFGVLDKIPVCFVRAVSWCSASVAIGAE